jgi:hypothetical protein
MAKQPKDHVKAHLRKNGVDPADVPDDVMDALNEFSVEELNRVDRLGETLEQADLPQGKRISMVH